MRRTLSLAALLALLVAGCGEAPKTPSSKAALMDGSPAKDGPSAAEKSAQLATAMAGDAAAKGTYAIQAGESVQGSLGKGDSMLEDGSYYDAWVFEMAAEGDVEISMASSELDSYLIVYRGVPGRLGTAEGSDDDSGGGLDALVRARLQPGTYTIMANTYVGGQSGAYTLSMSGSSGGGSGLQAGSSVSGEVDSSDETLGDGSYYEMYEYYGTAGERLTLTMTSTQVDSYLLLFVGSLEDGDLLAEDDDGAGIPDAQITVTLPVTGVYTVVANTYVAGETGRYQLAVETAEGQSGVAFDNTGSSTGRYALLVGIDDYPGTRSDLRGPVRDAQIMRDVLVDRFEFSPENVVMLTDSDATRENIANGILQHLGQAGPDGVAVFFYSGHGMQVGANIGLTGALDPEPRGDGDEALYIYGYDQDSSMLLDEELGFLLESLEAGRTLAVVDACFSGEITRAAGDAPQSKRVDLSDPEVAASLRMPTNFIAVEPKVAEALSDLSLGFGQLSSFAEVFANPQRHLMWGASTEDQVSWTSGLGGGASVFTWYVGERLNSAPLTSTLAEVQRLVASDVETYINGDGNMTMQNPQMRGSSASMTLEEFFRQR